MRKILKLWRKTNALIILTRSNLETYYNNLQNSKIIHITSKIFELLPKNQRNDCVNYLIEKHMQKNIEAFEVSPSRFQWEKAKALVNFYAMLGLIPMTVVIFCANVFVGPGKLTPIEDGYVPKHWEYQRSPISRFIARYIQPSYQESYEKLLHVLFEEGEKIELRRMEQRVRKRMSDKNDYKAYYYKPAVGKYFRISKEAADEIERRAGGI